MKDCSIGRGAVVSLKLNFHWGRGAWADQVKEDKLAAIQTSSTWGKVWPSNSDSPALVEAQSTWNHWPPSVQETKESKLRQGMWQNGSQRCLKTWGLWALGLIQEGTQASIDGDRECEGVCRNCRMTLATAELVGETKRAFPSIPSFLSFPKYLQVFYCLRFQGLLSPLGIPSCKNHHDYRSSRFPGLPQT